jgi:hypothetical protein
MDATRFDRSIQTMSQATGRRGAVRSLGAGGLALLAALGLADASARESRKGGVQADGKGKKKRKTKRGPTGPAGPAGPAGLAEFKTKTVIGANSESLPAATGSRVIATVDCGGEGKVVSCGYQTSGDATLFVNVFVSGVASNPARSVCVASLLRTTDVGSSAGANIQATAVCLD